MHHPALGSSSVTEIRKTFFLDILRGMAALYVLIGHARWLLWEGYTEGYKLHPEVYTPFETIQVWLFSVFAFGHQAVMLFFVLSGFVIHYSSYNQFLKSGTFSIGSYLVKRIRRIYPPFLFALLLTYIADSIGRGLGHNIYYGTTGFWLINKSIFSDLSFKTLLGNIGMVQTLVTPVWGSNGPLWSLMYEWWFYILYIPVFFINKRKPLLTAYAIALLFIAVLLIPADVCKGFKVLQYFFAWYLGVILADWYMDRLGGKLAKNSLLFFLLLIFIAATTLIGSAAMNDYYMSACFAVLIYLSLQFYMQLRHFRLVQPLSDFSYTLYVIHLPVLVLCSGWLQQRLSGALPMHFGYVYGSILACLLLAWLCHLIVEKPFLKKK